MERIDEEKKSNESIFKVVLHGLPVVQWDAALVLIRCDVDDSSIYCREILFQVQRAAHLCTLFGLVWMVLNCFYLWKKTNSTILTIDQDGEQQGTEREKSPFLFFFFFFKQWQDSMFCILFARWESIGIGWIMIWSFIIVSRQRCERARARVCQ